MPGVVVTTGVEPVPRSRVHKANAVWQFIKHELLWAILFFRMDVKLPAKLVAVEKRSSTTAAPSFIDI